MNDFNWSSSDYAVMAGLVAAFALAYVLIVKKVANLTHRILISLAFVALFVLVWAELAVGIFNTPFAGN